MAVWRREPEVVEMIRYFDQPERKGNWNALSNKEIKIILSELERCRDDFSYAARNYFMIVDKFGNDQPFRLWESQDLILEKWYWLREKYPDRAQKIMILKARQLGCSTVIEGLIAWKVIFFSNSQAMVVSHNDNHAAYLFQIMLHFYDMLPWWLQPMISSRKQDTGLFLANPDHKMRRERPGNNSLVSVQSATQVSGVGQGMKLNAIHASEYADWDWTKFKEIIDGDMVHALADNIHSFAFLESTGKGAGSPSEEMWVGQVELAEEAEWLPLFIPWFFEKTRFMPPEGGWRTQQPELDMREKVSRDWVVCSNVRCGQYFEASFRRQNRVDEQCPDCRLGVMKPVNLSDGQLRFMQHQRINADKKGPESIKKLREELATTAEEAFQLSGIQVFPAAAMDFVNVCVDENPIMTGMIDDKGQIHWVKDYDTGRCGIESCPHDHRWESEYPLQIWELPIGNVNYSIGVDVAEGLGGKADFSVIFINKISPNPRAPDEQVAVWRSNTVDPIQLASPVAWLGRLYNEALVSIEVNKFDTCFNTVRLQYNYPNLFVWKHYDSKNPISNKLGWFTNLRSKPMLWQTAVRWLKSRMWVVKSKNFAIEMKRFQKDEYDDQRAEAERNFHDDEIIAGMIALFCAHDLDYSEDMDYIPVHAKSGAVPLGKFMNRCERCACEFETMDNPGNACPRCSCMLITSSRDTKEGHKIDAEQWFKEMAGNNEEEESSAVFDKMALAGK